MTRRFRLTAAGLALTTLATLVLEILDTRLLSVLTWYHLSFLAVSLAMLGMAAGAVHVFLGGDRYSIENAPAVLPRVAHLLAWTIPASHLLNLAIPIPLLRDFAIMEVVVLAVATTVLAVPFILSGIVVTLALTRTPGAIGRLYAADLAGAAAGCLLVIALLGALNISSVAFLAGALAALAAWCFGGVPGSPSGRWRPLATAAVLAAAAIANTMAPSGVGVIYPKNRGLWQLGVPPEVAAWNTHSYVLIQKPQEERAFLWGPGQGAERFRSNVAWIAIDGDAGTPITQWDGRRESIDWTEYDVTSAPYHLRRGEAAVIGVGGGRDLLSALRGGSRVTGIEVNGILVDALRNRYRDFARLGSHPDVTIVHDEGRAYLSRHRGRFDVVQMSLIDTWAATGAGAFALSENGLYTREAWRVFLNALTPTGVFSVSRWFTPEQVSETTRILTLAVAALIDRGVADPGTHLAMIVRGNVATLVVSAQPLTADDRGRLQDLVSRFGFSLLVEPGRSPVDPQLAKITAARSLGELDAASAHPLFDFMAPSDERPFFFNMLKPLAFLQAGTLVRGGVMWGNLRATVTLVILLMVAAVLVAAIVFGPLVAAGRPSLPVGVWPLSLWYFAAIGTGFMLVQIPLLQRFSVYLGHPTFALAIVLFTMILAAGGGSALSDRIRLGSRAMWLTPIAIVLLLGLNIVLLQPVFDATVGSTFMARTAITVALIAPVSALLGCCFPIGMRLLGSSSQETAAWMWGVNGACGVMASIIAVAISMWIGTRANLLLAAATYLLLLVPMRGLYRKSAL